MRRSLIVLHASLGSSALALAALWAAGVRGTLHLVSALSVVTVFGVLSVFLRGCRHRSRPRILVGGAIGLPAAWAASAWAAVKDPSTVSGLNLEQALLLIAFPLATWVFLSLALQPEGIWRIRGAGRPAASEWDEIIESVAAWQRPMLETDQDVTPSSRAAISLSKSLAPSNSLYTEANRR